MLKIQKLLINDKLKCSIREANRSAEKLKKIRKRKTRKNIKKFTFNNERTFTLKPQLAEKLTKFFNNKRHLR